MQRDIPSGAVRMGTRDYSTGPPRMDPRDVRINYLEGELARSEFAASSYRRECDELRARAEQLVTENTRLRKEKDAGLPGVSAKERKLFEAKLTNLQQALAASQAQNAESANMIRRIAELERQLAASQNAASAAAPR